MVYKGLLQTVLSNNVLYKGYSLEDSEKKVENTLLLRKLRQAARYMIDVEKKGTRELIVCPCVIYLQNLTYQFELIVFGSRESSMLASHCRLCATLVDQNVL